MSPGDVADRDQTAAPGGGPQATQRALERLDDSRAIVLVEGISDQVALETLATRRGRDLDGEGVSVVPIGGAHAIGRFLARFGPYGSNANLAGLCDAGEEFFNAVSNEPASAPTSLAQIWNGWVSTCASQTWRTS